MVQVGLVEWLNEDGLVLDVDLGLEGELSLKLILVWRRRSWSWMQSLYWRKVNLATRRSVS